MKGESIFFGWSPWLPILYLISLNFMIQNYSITTHLSMCAWPFLKAKEVLFSLFNYNFYTIKYTDIKHAIQWVLTNTFMQQTFRSRSRTFPALQKVLLWPFHSILESLSLPEKEKRRKFALGCLLISCIVRLILSFYWLLFSSTLFL